MISYPGRLLVLRHFCLNSLISCFTFFSVFFNHLPHCSHSKMAFTAIFMSVALLHYASAQNITTSIIIPDGLFYPYAIPQTFVGEMTVTGRATYYTVGCGNYSEVNFWPGTSGCINNSYTFSANSDNTRFLLRE